MTEKFGAPKASLDKLAKAYIPPVDSAGKTAFQRAVERGFAERVADKAPAVVRSGVGKAIGGAALGVLASPTPAGAGSDKVPAPSERQRKVMNVDNSGLTKEKLP